MFWWYKLERREKHKGGELVGALKEDIGGVPLISLCSTCQREKV
jgi:hypothetical protein